MFPFPKLPVVLKLLLKLLRAVMIAALGAALTAKFLLESHAEPETEEIDLVAVFEGKHLASNADPFYGGHILSMFGGVLLDLRKANPAPTGIRLSTAVIMGGVSIIVPEGWQVVYEGNVYMGGWSDDTHATSDEDMPTVTITGYVIMGGIRAITMRRVEEVT